MHQRICIIVYPSLVLFALVSQAELIGYWSFDQHALTESSGYAQSAAGGNLAAGYHDGLGIGTLAYTDGPTGFGSALNLSASNTAVVVSNSFQSGGTFDYGHNQSVTNATPQTLACWVRAWPEIDYDPGDGSWFGSFMDKNGGNGSFRLGATSESTAGYKTTNRPLSGSGTSDLTDGEWHHVAGTFENTTIAPQVKLYVDGEVVAAGNFGVKWHHRYYLVFGAHDPNRNDGNYGPLEDFSRVQLDEIRLYNTALSPTEIQDLMIPSGGLDTDNDGLPDAIDPDDDNDGLSDEDEGFAGTDPLDPASTLELAILPTGSSLLHRLMFASVTDRLYEIERRTNLANDTWTTVTNGLPGNGNQMTIEDANGLSRGYYRLGVRLAP